MSFLARHIRAVIIVLGFVSSLIGTLGSFFFIDALNDQLKSLVDRRNGAAQESEKLGRQALDYFFANQQGDLIYALSLQEKSRRDMMALILQGNLYDRAEPVRNLIGALALARLLDYRKTYDEYERLNGSARKSLDSDSFWRVKALERQVVELAQKRVTDLQLGLVPLQQEITATEARLRSRQHIMLMFSSLGAFLLLVANLVEYKAKAGASE